MSIHRRVHSIIKRATVRLASSRRGAAAVEFALIGTIMAAMLTGVANYGMAQFDKMALRSAARAGAQMAIRDRTATSTIKTVAVNSTDLSLTTGDVSTVETCECADGTVLGACGDACADGGSNQYYMTVTVSETFTLLILGTDISLSESVKVRTQ